MQYSKLYNQLFLGLLLSLFIGCSDSNENDVLIENSVSIEIVSFIPSKNEVEISWNLKRYNGVIVTDLFISRFINDEDADNTNRQQIVANLPSNETTFIDKDVPYLENIKYVVKARFQVDGKDGVEFFDIQSEEVVFERNIIKISRIPDHIIQDQNDANSYHFLTQSLSLNLSRYNMINNQFEANKTYENAHFNDKLMTNEQAVFIGTKNGLIYSLNPVDYSENFTFSVPIEDELKSFGIVNDEIHYNDSDNWKYSNYLTNESGRVNDSFVINFVHTTNLESNKALLIMYNYPNFWGNIYDISNYNNIDLLHNTDFDVNFGSRLDKGILHFKRDKTEFISTIFGRVISTDDLSLKAELKYNTGVNYLYFNYGNNGKIYGAVQNEKLIHVFDDKSYELIETIKTKLYPIYPLISENGELQSLGRYSRVEYWDYFDGFGLFNSISNCAIETF